MLNATTIKVIAFDVFGTVFDFTGVDRQEIRDYLAAITAPEWRPLKLPESWEHLKPHGDSEAGISYLRDRFMVVTCSNGPLGLLAKLSKNADIQWDAIVPLELNRVYKPHPKAYMTVCEVLDVAPENVLMVTANESFGDLEASRALGMQAQLIRGGDGPKTIIGLATMLGCCTKYAEEP